MIYIYIYIYIYILNLEVPGSNPGQGSDLSLEFKFYSFKAQTIGMYLLVKMKLRYYWTKNLKFQTRSLIFA